MALSKRIKVLALAALTAAGAFAIVPSAGADQYVAREVAPPAASEVWETIAYLRERYGVSESEALRRIVAQRQADALASAVERQFPADYAGTWIDQANGGVVRVRSKRPELVKAMLGKLPRTLTVRVDKADFSQRELAASAAKALRGAPRSSGVESDLTSVYVDVPSNRVLVQRSRQADRRTMSATPVTGKGVVPANEPLPPMTTKVATMATPVTGFSGAGVMAAPPHGCYTSLICGAVPMKGGYRLELPRDDNSYAGCTNGFNVIAANGTRYTLTAGHCVTGPNHDDGLDYSTHNGIPVGVETWLTDSTFPDYTVMPYRTPNDTIKWLGQPGAANQNLVRSACASGNRPGACTWKDFAITGYKALRNVRVGAVVCATGAGDQDTHGGVGSKPGTRCGEITRVDAQSRIYTNTCSRSGDSGGPLFSQVDKNAYGILEGGTPGSGACGGVGSEYSTFSAIDSVLARLTKRSGQRFGVIGAPLYTP